MTSSEMMWNCPRCQVYPLEVGSSLRENFPAPDGILVHITGESEHPVTACTNCHLPVDLQRGGTSLVYEFRGLLAAQDWNRYVIWSLMQNNGLIAYSELRTASCSTDENIGSKRFAEWISGMNLTATRVLDLGCGPEPISAYLKGTISGDPVLIGLDPFPSDWEGPRVLGCAEYLPLRDEYLDVIVAATSLDHVFDLKKTVRELSRVLRPGGKLIVWDHGVPEAPPLKTRALGLLLRLKQGYSEIKYQGLRRIRVYDNGVVLPIHRGLSDPFHDPLSRKRGWPRYLRRTLEGAGFELLALSESGEFSSWSRAKRI